MIRVFIGHDTRQCVLTQTLMHSIVRRSSLPVSFTPLALSGLTQLFNRERDAKQSTDFSFSRFLTPFLCDYEGWALFMDSDMLVLDDIANLWSLRDDSFAVQVVKHCHKPKAANKFLGQVQTSYQRKNWSSLMLMNCAKCRALTPEYVSSASGLVLHRFHWLDSEELVGELPSSWNHLVDYDPALPLEELSLLHYTSGGPYYDAYKNCGYASEWLDERAHMLTVIEELR